MRSCKYRSARKSDLTRHQRSHNEKSRIDAKSSGSNSSASPACNKDKELLAIKDRLDILVQRQPAVEPARLNPGPQWKPAGTLDAESVDLVIKLNTAFSKPLIEAFGMRQERPQPVPENTSTPLGEWSKTQTAAWIKTLGVAYEPYAETFLANGSDI